MKSIRFLPRCASAALVVALGLTTATESFARGGADDAVAGNPGIGQNGRVPVGVPIKVDIETPERGHRVGIAGRGWFVDLKIDYNTPLADTGFTVNPDGTPGFQITGPGPHDNVAPMPGTFSPGADDRLPGLIVLLSTTTVGAGPCMNLANLFNLTGVTDLRANEAEIWDTWIIGAPNFGVDTPSTLFVAVADDLDGDGIYNDAPFAVPDVNGDGICTQTDLMAYGVASNIEQVRFFINGEVDLSGLPVVP